MKISPLFFATILITGLPAAFAAGWWLRSGPEQDAASGGEGRQLIVAPATPQTAAAAKPGASPLDGPAPIQIRPLTSLKEILAMLGPGGSIDDQASAAIAVMELMPRLMITDAGTVQAMLKELAETEGLNRDSRKMLTMGLMFRWMTVQPESAIGYSLANPNIMEDSKEMNMLGLLYMAKAKPEAARGLAALMPESERKDVDKFLIHLEGSSNPGGVLQDPAKTKNMSTDDKGKLAARWMRTDPAAALAWVQGLPEDQRSPEITSRVAAERMLSDPAATLAWINALPDGPEKTQSQSRITQGLLNGAKDQESFEAKLASLPAAWHDGARLEWLNQNPSQDPAATAEQLKGIFTRNPSLAGHYKSRRAMETVASGFTERGDFQGGADWAQTLPSGPAQASASAALARQWTDKDAGAASVWISGLPEGETRDAAATSMINEIQREDPSSALVWAQSLSTEEARIEQSRGVFQAWFRNQPLEAVQAIQTLPPEEQQRIFSKRVTLNPR